MKIIPATFDDPYLHFSAKLAKQKKEITHINK